ncbi:MAG: HalOD1 output domain-containing protein [Halovenus sp.]
MATSTADGDTGDREHTYRTQTDATGRDSFALSLIRALAAAKGTEPTDLSLDIYEHIDTDALEQLARHARETDSVTWRLEFAVEDQTITVSSDGWVEVS